MCKRKVLCINLKKMHVKGKVDEVKKKYVIISPYGMKTIKAYNDKEVEDYILSHFGEMAVLCSYIEQD